MISILNRIGEKTLLACSGLIVLLPTSPINMPFTYRDSGVFLYIGWRILNGELPYRDVWDHKPPVIYYLNAFGLALADGSRWGVWLVEYVSLFLALAIGFSIIKNIFGSFPAIYSLLLWLLTLVYTFEGGNITSEYVLPLQFLALWLVYKADITSVQPWRWFVLGLIGALAFFTKQTTIGIWIAILFVHMVTRLKDGQFKAWLREMAIILSGSLVVLVIIILFFGSQGSLTEFWDAVFRYNFYYPLDIDFITRVKMILIGLTRLTKTGLIQFALAGYGLAFLFLCTKNDVIKDWKPLVIIGVIDLPLEMVLVAISGKNYQHYYISMLPILALFSGLTFWAMLRQYSAWRFPNALKVAFQWSIVWMLLWGSLANYKQTLSTYAQKGNGRIIEYVEAHTAPGDTVLLMKAETSVNYFSKRRSPTRYVYQYPLYQNGYVDEGMILEFLDDILLNRPQLIIDAGNRLQPFADFPIQTEAIRKKAALIEAKYDSIVNLDNRIIYELIE